MAGELRPHGFDEPVICGDGDKRHDERDRVQEQGEMEKANRTGIRVVLILRIVVRRIVLVRRVAFVRRVVAVATAVRMANARMLPQVDRLARIREQQEPG